MHHVPDGRRAAQSAEMLLEVHLSWTDRGRIGSPEEVYDEMVACVDALALLMGAPRPAAEPEERM